MKKIIKRLLMLLKLPNNLRGLKPGTYFECQVDEGGQVFVMIRLDDFHRIAAAVITERERILKS